MKATVHRGEVIRDAIKASGVAVGVVADKLGVSRKTLYNKFKETGIPYSFILRLGEVIHHDFSEEFPHLSKNINKDATLQQPQNNASLLLPFDVEPQEIPKPGNMEACEAELLNLQRKYIALLEKFNELLLKTSKDR